MNKCLPKFYISVRKSDENYYKKTTLMAIRAALERHLKSPPHNKRFSICDNNLFNEANKTLDSYLKHLFSTGKITRAIHKMPLTMERERRACRGNNIQTSRVASAAYLVFYLAIFRQKRTRKTTTCCGYKPTYS